VEVEFDGQRFAIGETRGSGGFGRVYELIGASEPSVVKLVPKDPSAQRELLFAYDLSDVPHIVPVLEVGETADSWAIRMPQAEQSLEEFFDAAGGALQATEALPILIDLADALVSLSANGVVHRDLKPGNILFYEGHWCLSDFGISRYAEMSTSIDTHKYSMTPEYAAPEQWREQRATPATDIYAFGVVAYELLTGALPFSGPETADFREQHLKQDPPLLSSIAETPLRSIIDECLTKAPQARPQASRLRQRLLVQSESEQPSGGAAALSEAHQRQVRKLSEQARSESEKQIENERRAELFEAAVSSYNRIRDRLLNFVVQHAPSVEPHWPLTLGGAKLSMSVNLEPTSSGQMGAQRVPFDVITWAFISVDQSNVPSPSGDMYSGRRHALWFCDAQNEGDYAWFETAFMENVFVTRRAGFSASDAYYPKAASPRENVAIDALSSGVGVHQVAWPFTDLRDEGLDKFLNRWVEWLAKAQGGALRMPMTRPEYSSQIPGSYRH